VNFGKKPKRVASEIFLWKFFSRKFQDFIGMLGLLKKVPTINFGLIRQIYAALKMGKIARTPKISKVTSVVEA